MPDTTPRQAWASYCQVKNTPSYFSLCWEYQVMIFSGDMHSKHLIGMRNREKTKHATNLGCLHSASSGCVTDITEYLNCKKGVFQMRSFSQALQYSS